MTSRVVFVIMVISSLAFYAMAFRVPVVCIQPYGFWCRNLLLVAKTLVPYLNSIHHDFRCHFILCNGIR